MSAEKTSYTLIARAIDLGDQVAWRELVARYRRFVFYILRELGVRDDDLDDVAQQVLMRLTKDLATYDAGRARFRTWFSRLISNAAFTYFRRCQLERRHFEDVDLSQKESLVAEAAKVESKIQEEWTLFITHEAMDRVRKCFKGQAMEVFEMGLDGCSATEIAEKTQMSMHSVYTLRKRVKKRLYLEIRALTADLEK